MNETLRQRIDEQALWYHCIELAPGVVTPGWFDLRPVVDRMPWPDVEGKRCLDVATYDGFLAFELERRGASEVVATDVASHEDWDWLPRARALGPKYLETVAGTKGRGFELAAEALESSVERRFVNVYDLDPDDLGTFDVVVCGSLLLHLRDPFRALEAIRSVCAGEFMSAEQIDPATSVPLLRRQPRFVLRGRDGQWLVPNVTGHRRMLETAGFDITRALPPYAIPYGPAHPPAGRRGGETVIGSAVHRRVTGGVGVPMAAVLCRPMPDGSDAP